MANPAQPPSQPHQPWQSMTPAQQWHMHQQMVTLQQQQLQVQRQQAQTQARNRGTVNTLVGLFVWTPLIILAALFFLWIVTSNV